MPSDWYSPMIGFTPHCDIKNVFKLKFPAYTFKFIPIRENYQK